MAKQPRAPHPVAAKKEARPHPGKATPANKPGPAAGLTKGDGSGTMGHRSTYSDAVAVYEQAMRVLQQRNFTRAADLLGQLLHAYPEERELVERARLYLGLCKRQIHPPSAEPQSVTECLYAATLALNEGKPDRAIAYLDQALGQEPANDQALYMLGTAHAQHGNAELAIRYLQRAIAANAENRALAKTDPDLEALRADEAVMALLEGRPSIGAPKQGSTPGARNAR